ncbi:hypothetical protein [Sphingomonas soli]|uniref:hypothetical protein n=1 Tax=Sphingomonas soli TaxID=266127 RepID=UPI000833550A|nr:hypothetical protein [Sphingomonas soli]
MFLLAFALSVATVGPAPDLQRAQQTRRVRHTARRAKVVRVAKRARPGVTRIPIVAVSADPNQRYRLTDVRSERADGKELAVRDTGMPCGQTGAPVCPSNGVTVVKAPLQP